MDFPTNEGPTNRVSPIEPIYQKSLAEEVEESRRRALRYARRHRQRIMAEVSELLELLEEIEASHSASEINTL